MKPLYLLLLVVAACCAYVFAVGYKAPHVFPSAIHDRNSVQIDGVIDETKMQHISAKKCLTPESTICWDAEPEVIEQ